MEDGCKTDRKMDARGTKMEVRRAGQQAWWLSLGASGQGWGYGWPALTTMVPKTQYPRLSSGLHVHAHTGVHPHKHACIKNDSTKEEGGAGGSYLR